MNIRECKTGQVCDVTAPEMNLAHNATCAQPPSETMVGYPGDKCSSNSACLSNTCTNSTCVGIGLDGDCSNDLDGCDYSLQCNANSFFKCKPQITTGSKGCDSDLSCMNNAGCNKTLATLEGTCLEYFSIESGSIVSCDNIDGYGVNFLCKSGASQSYNAKEGTCMCIDAPKSTNTPPYKCSAS